MCARGRGARARACLRSAHRDRRSCVKPACPTATRLCLCWLARSPGLGLGLYLSLSRSLALGVVVSRCRDVAVSRCHGGSVSRPLGRSVARSLARVRRDGAEVVARARASAHERVTIGSRQTHVAAGAPGSGRVVVMREPRGQRQERTRRRRRWLLRAGTALRSAMPLRTRAPSSRGGPSSLTIIRSTVHIGSL